MLPPVQTVWAEAKTIVEPNPSIPGPISLVTLDQLFESGSGDSGLPAFCDRKYLPGQYLIECGCTPDRIIAVMDGLAVLEVDDLSTGEYKARILFPGEVVGLMETLAGRPISYNVIASTECTVRSIIRTDLIRHIAERPELRSRVVRLLADLVRDADRLLKQL